MNIYGIKINKSESIFEIGGGDGELTKLLLDKGYSVIGFIEPDISKINTAKKNLSGYQVNIYSLFLTDEEVLKEIARYKYPLLILQDVIEHITAQDFYQAIKFLRSSGCHPRIIGRTPNLSSPFGLRNSFGDLTHIHRFNSKSLEEYFFNTGFKKIIVNGEPYVVTGIVSLVRMFAYHAVMLLTSIAFIFVYGSNEGYATPNIVFDVKSYE
jgi:hypothetical protein